MAYCASCGGELGRDCWNPQDCAEISRQISMASALPPDEPVAWRVKDFADGWILFHTLEEAEREARDCGNLIQPLYTRHEGSAVTAQNPPLSAGEG